MRVLHFDCFSGISGDMTLAALISAGVPAAVVQAGLASLSLPLELRVESVRRCGLAATAAIVKADDPQPHRHLADILEVIHRGQITANAKALAQRIFRRLAEAEAKVHGTSIDQVHFHEVGALDSIADIVGSAIGLDFLAAERITSRAVPPGQGTIKAAHGIMPVPAPATTELLRGVPLATTPVKGELTTPTGAAILTSVVQEWTDQPEMVIDAVGYGAGSKDFPQQPNVLRLLVGRSVDVPGTVGQTDCVWVVETNVDDVPGEVLGYTLERLLAAGAVDAFTQPIGMKKQRPGVLVTALAPPAALAAVEEVLFSETATLGVRRTLALRTKVEREILSVPTPWGQVRCKVAYRAGANLVIAPEYEDCAGVARTHGIPLRVVYDCARQEALRLLPKRNH